MSDAPHKFDLHIGDYVRDTEDLSLTQHGIYLKLMIWYYSTAKPIPNDLDRIFCRIRAASKEERVSTEFILTEFFRLENGKWVHKRIEEELANWGMATECARKSAKKRWEEYRKNKELANADAVKAHCAGNASLLPVASYQLPKVKTLAQNEFARFWKAYPKKKSKGQAEKAFSKIKPELVETIMKSLAKARESPDWQKEGGTYIPYPAKWLNARGWEDEFSVETGPQAAPCTACSNPSTTWWLGKRYCEQHYMQAKRGELCKN